MKITLIIIAFIVACITALAIVGHIEKRKQRKFLTKFNQESLDSFMKGVKKKKAKKYSRKKAKKYSRKRTPKVPTIKK